MFSLFFLPLSFAFPNVRNVHSRTHIGKLSCKSRRANCEHCEHWTTDKELRKRKALVELTGMEGRAGAAPSTARGPRQNVRDKTAADVVVVVLSGFCSVLVRQLGVSRHASLTSAERHSGTLARVEDTLPPPWASRYTDHPLVGIPTTPFSVDRLPPYRYTDYPLVGRPTPLGSVDR